MFSDILIFVENVKPLQTNKPCYNYISDVVGIALW